MSVNSFLCWLGTATSPFCSFYSSFLQQHLPEFKISSLTLQARCLSALKRLGTTISYKRTPTGTIFPVSICIFADAGRLTDYGQLSTIGGVLLGDLAKDSPLYVLSWSSHKSRRPVESIGSAEILAVGEAIDDRKILKSTISIILNIEVKLIIATDSKDLFTFLSTQRNSIDKSIRADVTLIRYEFVTHSVDKIVSINGTINQADPWTKRDSALCDMLQLMIFTGTLPMDFAEAEVRLSPLG